MRRYGCIIARKSCCGTLQNYVPDPKYLCQQLVAGMNWYMGRKLTYRMEEAVR